MTTEFIQLNLHPQLVQAVTERGYQAPMPIQSAIIPIMVTGQDVIGQAQTGTGKTAAFALPILHNLQANQDHIQALVLAPTRELALQVAGAITDYGRYCNARVLAVYGGQAYGPQIGRLKRGVDVVVGTPGRIIDLIERGVLDLSQVRTVVLDEADEMLSMGFVEDIEVILSSTPAERQTALFSATLPGPIRRLADRYMHEPQSITIRSEQVTVDTIEQRCYLVNSHDKLAALTRLFEMEDISSALVFVRTRTGTGELSNELTLRGFPAEALNGDLSQDAREQTLNRFRRGQIKVLVATDVAARGLDIEDISHVFNFDLPDDPEVYVHRIGRTGRAGKTGVAISLLTPGERRRMAQIESFARQKIRRVALPTAEEILASRETQLMQQMTMWLQRGRCHREHQLVETLVEAGHDPLTIAAVALKIARAEEKQRPIAPLSEVVETSFDRPRRERGHSGVTGRAPRAWAEKSHEPGMVRLSLNMGKRDGIRPSDIVGAIATHTDIPGSGIGKIRIQEGHSLVDVQEAYVSQVLAKAGAVRIHRQTIELHPVSSN
ncbi:MAG: DEAD/DEAH box helicase [Chloroflexi bacterium]|jgi:ATP-dependent RNA helicase DeaD|nr:DEAD/DEAH box helicase [Chloroflexota bacterium]